MEIAPLLFDLGRPSKPTTRQVADLVRAGGAEALTEAIRRADETEDMGLRVAVRWGPTNVYFNVGRLRECLAMVEEGLRLAQGEI